MIRQSKFSGSFYPNSPDEIREMFKHFNQTQSAKAPKNIKAVIVPHAGYIYSGFTAHQIFSHLQEENYKRVVVIGPSHHIYFEGTSISMQDKYETPLGELEIDNSYSKFLLNKFNLGFAEAAHKEHSTEVQMPFIKEYLPNLPIIEMVYSGEEPNKLVPIIEYLLNSETLVVISTDLSHFHTLKEANSLDKICLDAIETLDTKKLHNGCEACGIIGVEALLLAAKSLNLKSKLSSYTTSADASKDETSVVGYAGAFIYKS